MAPHRQSRGSCFQLWARPSWPGCCALPGHEGGFWGGSVGTCSPRCAAQPFPGVADNQGLTCSFLGLLSRGVRLKPGLGAWAERSSVICTSPTRKGPYYLNAKCLRVQDRQAFVIYRMASLGKMWFLSPSSARSASENPKHRVQKQNRERKFFNQPFSIIILTAVSFLPAFFLTCNQNRLYPPFKKTLKSIAEE